MCQVGVRCYSDSSYKLKAETKRLADVDASIAVCKDNMAKAANDSNFEEFSKARKESSELRAKRSRIVSELNSARRDVDGTKKGKAILEEAMMNSVSSEEYDMLRSRKNQGEATAFVRAYSAKFKASGRKPAIFLPGEKKPSRRMAA